MAAATATHRCSHCSRDFGRAEHLRRHERTHTNEKPYICDLCPEAYSRRDLLRRHEIKVHDISTGVRQRRKSQNSSGSSPRSTQNPRRGSKTSFIAVESPLQDHPETDGLEKQHPQLPDQTQHGMWDMSLPSYFEHAEKWPNEQWVNTEPPHQPFGGHHDIDSSQWLNGFYDQNIPGGLPEDVDPRIGLDPALMEPSFPVDMARMADLNHSLTPAMDFNTFPLPTQQPLVADNLRVIQEYWDTIQVETAHLQLSPLPPPNKLSQYINRYVACIHKHQPLFQDRIWSPNTSPVALTLAVCANGARYTKEIENAGELFRLAASVTKPEDEGLWTLQYGILMIAYGAWSGDQKDLDVSFNIIGRLASDVRREWAKARATSEDTPPTWEAWCERETLKRCTYCSCTVMNLISVAYDIPAQLELDDSFGLPAHDAQWQATDADSWHAATRTVGVQEWRKLGDIIQRLGDESLPVPTGVGMLGCHFAISSLCQKVILFRKACSSNPQLFSQGQSYFSHCLQRWQQMWEQEPGSAFTLDDPQGPALLDSTALLRVATIRLAADYSPIRRVFITIPSLGNLSNLTNNLPTMSRNDQSSRAALQACLALRVPAQVGFTADAGAGSWMWSIQHSLSYFECALFLTHWLELVQNASDLTFDENHVLNMLMQIIESPGMDLNFNSSLSLRVMQMFIKLLDAGGSTIWGLTSKMGRVLQGVSQRLQGGQIPLSTF